MKRTIIKILPVIILLLSAPDIHGGNSRLGELRLLTEKNILPQFDGNVYTYNVTLGNKGTVVVSAAPEDGASTVTVTSNGVIYGNHSEISVSDTGQRVEIAVTNGEEKSVYTVNFELETTLEGDFRQLSIYQIMPAAFMRSETGVPGFSDFWGPAGHRTDGNIKGITESLDYIKGMGFNAIWLTPVFDTRGGRGGEKLQATGYSVTDFFNIDPRFGTNEEFRELINEAHHRDIYIILDITCGHHGLNAKASPNGNTIDVQDAVPNDRGSSDWYGNIAYPGSLDFFKEVFRYWMEEYEVDGWRLDVAYQLIQNGHNYWKELREEVDAVAAERRAAGHPWGSLGYMVGEDWTSPDNVLCTKNGGVTSVFDFDGRGRMIDIGSNIYNISSIYGNPTGRGYDSGVTPNIFITNHDMTRIADIFPDVKRLMFQYAVIAAYTGPVTFYYNDEFGVKNGVGNADNRGRVSGRTAPETPEEEWLYESTKKLFNLRADNPAMWRGEYAIRYEGNACEVTKTDAETGNTIVIILPINNTYWTFNQPVTDIISGQTYSGRVNIPSFTPVIYKVK